MSLITIQPLGRNREAPRLWIESRRLDALGFSHGMPLSVEQGVDGVTLRPAVLGENHVSSRRVAGGRRPIIDLASQSMLAGLAEYSEVKIIASFERIQVTPSHRAFAIQRSRRLQAPLRVLEVFAGGGTMTASLERQSLFRAVPPAGSARGEDQRRKRKARQPVRTGVPTNLPLRTSTVLIPAEVQATPELFREIDRTVTQVLDYEPGRFCRDEIIRPRYVRRAAAALPTDAAAPNAPEVLAAPLPNRLIEKGLPGVGLLVHLILSRYEDHQPFYRLEKGFGERAGVRLSRQTMIDWLDAVADWFQPLLGLIKEQLFQTTYLQVDETPIRYLDRACPGQSQRGYFWVYHHPGGDVLFDRQTSRGREGPPSSWPATRDGCSAMGMACIPPWRRSSRSGPSTSVSRTGGGSSSRPRTRNGGRVGSWASSADSQSR